VKKHPEYGQRVHDVIMRVIERQQREETQQKEKQL
jgi:hypothetical protein